MVGLSYGATSLFTTCSVLEIWWLKLQLKSCSEMGVPVLRPPEQLLLSGIPSGMGNKGNRVSRKRKKEEITRIVPLPLPSSTKKTHRLADQSQMHPILLHEQIMETIPHIQESNIGSSSLTLDLIRSHTSQNAHNVSTSETSTSVIPTEEASTVSETTSVSNLLPHYTTFQVPQLLARYPIYPTEQFQSPFFWWTRYTVSFSTSWNQFSYHYW